MATTVKERTTANRTGVGVDPGRAEAMVAATREFPPSSARDGQAIAATRAQYAAEEQRLAEQQAGNGTSLLMDKLGERLAFERAGTRLYEALLSKHEAYGAFAGGPTRDDIAHVMSEELEHFHLLRGAIEQLGGDPTELTPSANVQLTASHGVAQVLTDPRTTLLQSLEAIAIAELADNECWETLANLARMAGHEQMAEQFEQALATEEEHLEKVRSWLAAGQGTIETEGEGAVAHSAANKRASSERAQGERSTSGRRRR